MIKLRFLFYVCILYLCGCSQPEAENRSNILAFNQTMNAVDIESIKLHTLSKQLSTSTSLTEKHQLACQEIPNQYDEIERLLVNNRDHIVAEHLSLVDAFLVRLDEQRLAFKSSIYC